MKLDPKLQAQLGQMFAPPQGESDIAGALLLDIDRIQTVPQPRTRFDPVALAELEASIRQLREQSRGIGGTGILQPLLVRPNDNTSEDAAPGSGSPVGRYLLVAGERRLRAARAAGLEQVPVMVAGAGAQEAAMSAEDAWEQAIMENLLRDDLDVLDEAQALHTLMQRRGYSLREAARRLGKDKGYLENRLFLLRAPQDVRALVAQRSDTVRHAREIARVKDPGARRELLESAALGAPLKAIQERVQAITQPGAKSHSTPGWAQEDAGQQASGLAHGLDEAAGTGQARPALNLASKPSQGASPAQVKSHLSDHVAALSTAITSLQAAAGALPPGSTELARLALEVEEQAARLSDIAEELRA